MVMIHGFRRRPQSGGHGNDGGWHGRLNDTWEWNGVDWVETNPAHQPVIGYAHSMAYDSAGGVAVVFGGGYGGTSHYDDTWIWNGFDWAQGELDW
ncbi:hypothetical protein ACFL59_14215 [Planctomycetota bacterium]